MAYNEERMRDLLDPVDLRGYLFTGEFWNRTLQNWQSELLAIGKHGGVRHLPARAGRLA